MKKVMIWLFTTTLLASLLPVPAFAEDGAKVVLEAPAYTFPGETIEVRVNLENCSGYCGIGLEIDYDETVLTLVGIDNQGKGQFIASEEMNVKPYALTWTSGSKQTYNGTLAVLTFAVEQETQTMSKSPVSVSFYKGTNGNYVDGVNVNFVLDDTTSERTSLNLSYRGAEIMIANENQVTVSMTTGSYEIGGIADVTIQYPTDSAKRIFVATYNEKGQMTNAEYASVSAGVPEQSFSIAVPAGTETIQAFLMDEDYKPL